MSLVIFLNGCGSAGKTSIARSIQHLSNKPWLRLGMDAFIEMMPDRYIAFGEKANEGYFSFARRENNRGVTIDVEGGPLGNQVFNAIPTIGKVLADQGNDLIIDEVLFGEQILRTYINALKSHKVYFIGVFCDLQTLLEREILRRDRAIGLANGQMDRVHAGIRDYDLKVDATTTSSFSIAKDILAFIDKTPAPEGFQKMQAMF